MVDKKFTAREKRGFATRNENDLFIERSDNELLSLLRSDNPKERTLSARALGNRKTQNIIIALCDQLKVERSLYSKIAISESLGRIGKSSIDELIKHLGEIGNNQHKTLPEKKFKKNNYPCSRDIIARTICKIGEPVLDDLNKLLSGNDIKKISEAIDAIGYISYYSNNKTSFNTIKQALKKFCDNDIIIWKLIRALSAFPGEETELLLSDIIERTRIKEHKWEANRSLRLIM